MLRCENALIVEHEPLSQYISEINCNTLQERTTIRFRNITSFTSETTCNTFWVRDNVRFRESVVISSAGQVIGAKNPLLVTGVRHGE